MDNRVEVVTAYKFEDLLYETKGEAEGVANLQELQELVEKHYYRGIDENEIARIIIENKEKILSILNKL